MNTDKHEPAVPDADSDLLQRVRSKVVAHARESARASHSTVRAAEGTWTQLAPGVLRKVLNETDGIVTALYNLSPGARLPGHMHAKAEECVVLEGTFRIGDLVLSAGDYHAGHRGVAHADSTTETGAVLFVRGG